MCGTTAYREWVNKQKLSMRQIHLPGDKSFVDFCGRTMPVTNPDNGTVNRFVTRYAALPTRIRLDDASVHGKPFALDQTCVHAATQHLIEQPAKQIAVPKTAVSILGKGRVVGDFIFKAQPAEPAIRQVQMGLFAQPPL